MKFQVSTELRTNEVDTTAIEIEDLQVDKFARNFNSPLTDLNDPVITQVLPFNSPVIVVPMSRIMASAGESPSIPISAILAERVPPPPVGTPRTNIHDTPLTPASWVVQPPTSMNAAWPL